MYKVSRGTSREFTKLQAKESQPSKLGGGGEIWGTEGNTYKKGNLKGLMMKGKWVRVIGPVNT